MVDDDEAFNSACGRQTSAVTQGWIGSSEYAR